ncbi:MAG: PqiC family protein [Panacagrimonas sp.]
MNNFFRRASAALAMLVISACASSPPVRFYTLVDLGAAPQPADAAAPYAIALDPVSVPRQVDVPQLVVATRDGSALRLAENHRWLAPLGEEIRAALSQHLQASLGVADVSRVSAPTDTRVYRLKVDVQRFESSAPGDQALVAVQWSLRDNASATVLASCTTRAQNASPAKSHDGLVIAYKRDIASIAGQIAFAIGQLARDPASFSCPVNAALGL